MKRIDIILASMLLIAASCAKENLSQHRNESVKLSQVSFTTSLQEVQRKTQLDGKKVLWLEDDKISIFDNSYRTNAEFCVEAINGTEASFSGYTNEASTYFAIYPYSASNKMTVKVDGETTTTIIETTLPYYQKAVKGGFDDDLNIMVARTTKEDAHLSFKNVCSLIKINVPESLNNVVSIGLSAREIMAGLVRIQFAEDGTYTMNSENNATNTTNYKEIVLASEDGSALVPGDYYFVTRPNLSTYPGFNVTVAFADGSVRAVKLKEDKEARMEENNVYNLGSINVGKLKDFTITNASVGDFPMGLKEYQLEWNKDQVTGTPTFNTRTNAIATVNSDGLVTFTGKIGTAVIGVNYAGVDYRVAFNIAKGYYKEEYNLESMTANKWYEASPWANSNHQASAPELTETALKIYPKLTVKTDGDKTYNSYRCDLIKKCPAYLNIDYPIVCFHLDDVKDIYGVNRNITFDVVEKDGGVGGAVQANNNDGKYKYTVDGKKILIYDLTQQKIKDKYLSDYGIIEFTKAFQLKYADINDSTKNTELPDDLSLNFYGFYTFRTLEEAKAYFNITE